MQEAGAMEESTTHEISIQFLTLHEYTSVNLSKQNKKQDKNPLIGECK